MQKSFQGLLEPLESAFRSVVVRIPFDPAKAWPVRSKLRVKGSIRTARPEAEAHSFATSLLGSQRRGYFLLVTQKMRKAAHLAPGTLAEIVLEPDLDGRAATPPPELAKLFKADRSVRKWFETLNYSTRKYIADTVAEPKSADARVRRAEQWMERLMLVMEGEESAPPILQMAFRRQPMARAGWEALTSNQRRLSLLGIFSCQSPEAQAKRVDRVVSEAIQAAKRQARAKSASNPEE